MNMSVLLRYPIFLQFSLVIMASATQSQRIAIAKLVPQSPVTTHNIFGNVSFTETQEGLLIAGTITGLSAGYYGFHVHELGDITTCDSSGAHFNPEATNHGGREHTVRHVGDLGNIAFLENEVATFEILDKILTLRGRNNVLGRTLVLHERKDDLGLGGHETSLTTGNAGPRVACGVIGISSPAEPWYDSSAVTGGPSLLLIVTGLFVYYKQTLNHE